VFKETKVTKGIRAIRDGKATTPEAKAHRVSGLKEVRGTKDYKAIKASKALRVIRESLARKG
jgi:hypothetical protein